MYVAFILGSLMNSKIRQGLIGRIGSLKKLSAFIDRVAPSKKIILIHSSSVGEWEQSEQIINELKKNHSNLVFIATFFSPSGFNHVTSDAIDYKLYLPLDDPFSTKKLFKITKPTCWIIAKYDLWPNAVHAALWAKTPIILASAELAEDSQRHKGLLGYFNKIFYSKVDYILPVSEEYAERFRLIYNKPEALIVTGDARYDQIYQKAQCFSEQTPLNLFENNAPTMICGSTWPEDEKVLFPALADLQKSNIDFNIVIVPHEISEKHNSNIEAFWAQNGKKCKRYTQLDQDEKLDGDILIVDTIGLLAKLYQSADFVYVGGSFSSGVHNVLEPAAFSNPVIYGPRYKNSYEAKQLIKLEAGVSIADSKEAQKIIGKFVSEKHIRKTKGAIARQFLAESLGAAEKTAKIVEQYL